jgi:chromate transporter
MRGVSLREAAGVWARVAALSFGGPAGQIATMHRILVEERRWIGEARFLHALSFCTLLPGPEAQQLAIYLGWLLNGARGGMLAGGLFVLPGALAIMGLSVVYAAWGRTGGVAALFFGLKAAVLAVVLQAVLRVGRRALRARALMGVAVAGFVAIFFFAAPFPAVVAAAGLFGWLARPGPPPAAVEADAMLRDAPSEAGTRRAAAAWLALWLAPTAALLAVLGPDDVFSRIATFFTEMAVVGFGGAYAVLAYVAQEAVERLHWLQPGEMLDGLGMAETTPGPLVMVLQFVGFLAAYRDPDGLAPMLAGALGGLLATWVTFAPCFLWVFAGAPFVEALRGNRALAGALSAITAAVVGVILNLAVWFALHTWFRESRPVRALGLSFDAPEIASLDPWALALSLAALLAVLRFKAGAAPTLLGCAAAGLALHFAAGVL